ncbi:hypothetical protein [Streptomyces sp. NPDC002671]
MAKTAGALGELTRAVLELARGQGRLITAMSDVAREQRITTSSSARRSRQTPWRRPGS